MVPMSENLPEFDEYFRTLNPRTSNNPWLTEFLKQYTNCTTTEYVLRSLPNCNDPGLLRSLDSDATSHQEILVMDGVFALAYALDSLYRDRCLNNTTSHKCSEVVTIKGKDLLKELLSITFPSLANRSVSFTPKGDVPGRYFIIQIQKSNTGGYQFADIGKWDESTTSDDIIQQDIPWYVWEGASRDTYTGVPRSVCSEPCGQGERAIVSPDDLCCWTCSRCNMHDILVDNNCRSCIDKENGVYAWPDETFTKCVPIDPDKKTWANAIIAASSLGIFVTVVIMGMYTYNYHNALVKASSRELSYIMFVGKYRSLDQWHHLVIVKTGRRRVIGV